MEALLTVEQAAEMLALAPRTIRMLVARGDLPIVRPTPGSVRVSMDDLREYVAERRRRGPNPLLAA